MVGGNDATEITVRFKYLLFSVIIGMLNQETNSLLLATSLVLLLLLLVVNGSQIMVSQSSVPIQIPHVSGSKNEVISQIMVQLK